MNIAKLTKYNLSKSFDKRINLAELEEKISFAQMRGDLAALRAEIAKEISNTVTKTWQNSFN
jgi:hypothetical protein